MENLSEFGRRVKEKRLALGITQDELAKKSGYTSRSSINKIELGLIDLPQSKISAIANALYVSPTYLIGWDNNRSKQPRNIYTVEKIITFEELGTICAGFNGTVNETTTGEIIELPRSMIKGGSKEDYFVLRVQGNSMYPRILEGDRILCKRCSSVDSGDFAVVLYDGECATVKKVHYVNGEDWLELIPINPEYTTKRIEGSDLEQCRILGKVVKLIRDL